MTNGREDNAALLREVRARVDAFVAASKAFCMEMTTLSAETAERIHESHELLSRLSRRDTPRHYATLEGLESCVDKVAEGFWRESIQNPGVLLGFG
jgi:hypothetical protein